MFRKTSLVIAGLVLLTSLGAACGSTPMSDMPSGDGHMGHGGPSAVAEGARKVRVTARSFAFEPREIRARAGENLAVVLTSEDGTHDFKIDELDAHVAADGGETETGGVSDVEPGSYTFYCSVAGHRAAGMEGTLVVE